MWSWPLPNCVPWEIPCGNHPGTFGFPRKRERHSGVDLYAPDGHPVHAVEDCVVLRVVPFTGTHAGSPWWRTTWALLAKGASGVVVYGEIEALEKLEKEGGTLKQGDLLGHVTPVLYEDKGNGTSMLHLELRDTTSATGLQDWGLGTPQPQGLWDPSYFLTQAWSRVTTRFHRDGPKPPSTVKERRALIQWLNEHPLWQHPTTIRVPPDFHTNPDVQLFTPEKDDWVNEVISDGSLHELLEIDFTYVDPTTEARCKDETRNTDFRVWLEAGGWYDESLAHPEMKDRWGKIHDLKLDCGAATLESALVELALRVKFFYNDDGTERKDAPRECGERCPGENFISACDEAEDGFCQHCGFLLCDEGAD